MPAFAREASRHHLLVLVPPPARPAGQGLDQISRVLPADAGMSRVAQAQHVSPFRALALAAVRNGHSSCSLRLKSVNRTLPRKAKGSIARHDEL